LPEPFIPTVAISDRGKSEGGPPCVVVCFFKVFFLPEALIGMAPPRLAGKMGDTPGSLCPIDLSFPWVINLVDFPSLTAGALRLRGIRI